MHYHIDKTAAQSAYLQLYHQLRRDIVSGVYPLGTKLPSKRLIAGETGVSVITVEHALAILCDEGYLESRERSGFFVSFAAADCFPVSEMENDRRALSLHGTEDEFPFPSLAKTMRRVLSEYGESILVKSPSNGCDGQRGVGPLNARHAMARAVELAHQFGIGMVALGNNNHWMRGGTYGWQAADAGCIGICWSNTCPNMPAWGAKDSRIGNNPLILAVPRASGEHIMLDCALSQFSYGKLETLRLAGKQLPVVGGYDENGQLTTAPAAIEKTRRMVPIGYWKGSGLSILLDMIGTILTGANSVAKVGTFGDEVGLTQIMIAIDPAKFQSADLTAAVIAAIAADVAASEPAEPGREVRCPGMGEHRSRKENMELGIPVAEEKWAEVLAM